MLPWCLFWMACRPLLGLQWPPFEWSGSIGRLVAALGTDLGSALPLALFAAGVVLLGEMGYTRQLIRGAITISVLVGVISYGLVAWVAPTMILRTLVSSDDTMDAWPVTPSEILRDLRYVEANPPEEYRMQGGYPPRFPPNVLRWRLHAPLAGAVFGIVNILLGVLSAQLTVDLQRGRRRNALLAIALGSWIGFLALRVLLNPIGPFDRDGTMTSGIAAAWVPLAWPLAGALLLTYLVQRRRYG